METISLSKPLPRKILVTAEKYRAGNSTPVSYTHLDVYKRQVQTGVCVYGEPKKTLVQIFILLKKIAQLLYLSLIHI